MSDTELQPDRYWGLALDPIHIGSGGYSLGRVDNSIVREPATGVPKIPGTSLSGAIRAYATLIKEDRTEGEFSNILIEDLFGTEKEPARQGMLRFYDAQIVLFPVNTTQGTVWLSTMDRLALSPLYAESSDAKRDIKSKFVEDKFVPISDNINAQALDFGWLLLAADSEGREDFKEYRHSLEELKKLFPVIGEAALVSDRLFQHIVNDNLEVRTSVKIDPQTGAAETGALFTYEAIPTGTVLGFEILRDRHRMNSKDPKSRNAADKLLSQAVDYLKLLGVGGMGTRGFGRLLVRNHSENSKDGGQ